MDDYKFIVVGSGLAGLSFALKASSLGKVALLSKSELIQTNTWRAQGGMAAVISKADSFAKHIEDTLKAGDGLCSKKNVKQIIESAPERVQELTNLGVHFDQSNGHIDLAREGGHSQRRILHVEDQTGQALHKHFISLALENPNIEIFENTFVRKLLGSQEHCYGLEAFDQNNTYKFQAPQTILASGGTGKVFLYTSNWSGATGDGLALAYRLGARLSNLEFTQFHPTCLFHPQARNFLISEALRGEGARLVNQSGEAFMKKYHPLMELAPRDKVARAIDSEMKATGSDCVFLDLRHLAKNKPNERFPKIYQQCLDLGIDFLKQTIPVVPAAHYMCGGIEVDTKFQTNVPGLYAIGETCDVGLHGANRLASNSLLECLVSSHFAFESLKRTSNDASPKSSYHRLEAPQPLQTDIQIQVTSMWEEVRQLMWNNMGLVRSQRLMLRAQKKLLSLEEEIYELKQEFTHLNSSAHFLELENITLLGRLMTQAALHRKESRGCHFDEDFTSQHSRPKKSRQHKDCGIEYIEN